MKAFVTLDRVCLLHGQLPVIQGLRRPRRRPGPRRNNGLSAVFARAENAHAGAAEPEVKNLKIGFGVDLPFAPHVIALEKGWFQEAGFKSVEPKSFSAGALANGGSLGRLQLAIVNAALFGLPVLSVLSAGIVTYLHLHGGGRQSYWWYAMPLAGAALYIAYAMAAGRRM